jgi:hypothetical protein
MQERSRYFRFKSAYNAFLGANRLHEVILLLGNPNRDRITFPEGPSTLIDDKVIEYCRTKADQAMACPAKPGETPLGYIEAALEECHRALESARGRPVIDAVPPLKKIISQFVEVLHETLDRECDRLPQERGITPDEQGRLFDRIVEETPEKRRRIVDPFKNDLERGGLLPRPTKDKGSFDVEGEPRAKGASDVEIPTM